MIAVPNPDNYPSENSWRDALFASGERASSAQQDLARARAVPPTWKPTTVGDTHAGYR